MARTAQTLDTAQARSAANDRAGGVRRKAKIAAVLITSDDSLWPQIGKFVTSQFTLKQSDSIEQVLRDTDAGAAVVLIWDARGEASPLQRVTTLQQHSSRFAVLAIDLAATASNWDSLIRTNQIVALVALPIAEGEFVKSLNKAGDEVLARSALLGDPLASAAAKDPESAPLTARAGRAWIVAGLLAAVAALAAVFVANRGLAPSRPAAPAAVVEPGVAIEASPSAEIRPAPGASATASDQVEELLEKAGQAMLDRRYMLPADNSALYFYRRVLNFDVQNGEAEQGLARLAELLLARAQSALDSHQFDQALQALETARSLKPDDPRTRALDARLASMRSELGTTQIQAALNAQNFERASALIDEAARARAIGPAQTAQLREALKHQREGFDINRFVRLAQARLQQDHLLEPENDSAAFYLERARRAGASEPALAESTAALLHRVLEAARAAIDQHRFNEADRWIAAARSEGAGGASLGALQRDLTNARAQESRDRTDAAVAAVPRAADAAHPAPSLSAMGGAADMLPGQSPLSPAPAAAAPELTLVLTKPIHPEYPQTAALKGIEGWVALTFTVGADGRVITARVIEANPAGVFDSAALKALQSARYQPLSKTDATVYRQAKVKLAFRLTK